jgi:hypothetical protein
MNEILDINLSQEENREVKKFMIEHSYTKVSGLIQNTFAK